MHPKLDFSFNRVREIVKRDHSDLLDDYNALGSLVLLATSIIATEPSVAATTATINALADVFGVKNEIVGIGKSLLQKLKGRSGGSTLTLLRRMQLAYSVICYTSYFEAFELVLPELAQDFHERPEERRAAVENAVKEAKLKHQISSDAHLLNMPLLLPNPTQPFNEQKAQLLPMYKELTQQLQTRFEGLPGWEGATEVGHDYIVNALNDLPELAFETFRSQYFVLSTEFPEFAIWANLREHQETREHLDRLPIYFQQLFKLTDDNQRSLDIGFQRLDAVANKLQINATNQQASQIIRWLSNHYSTAVEYSIFQDTGAEESNMPQLRFPKKAEIFVPQAFKSLIYTGKERLEREETWKERPVQQDLNTFLLEQLRSPHSVLTPLIILGMPGSGKSLLSSMIAARLSLPDYRPIRVELRNIDAELPLYQQVTQQIEYITGSSTDWATIATNVDQSLLLILDGYDELLQVRDKVFGNYLNAVAQFQESELDMGRAPVRAIVTSRITLIDKARIPRGAMIVRLQGFDDARQQQWINIWNTTNQDYFQRSETQPFVLTQDPKVLELAEQPLLLMMLALYDSTGNQLQQSQTLNRTVLYDRLLRQFVQRECLKRQDHREKDAEHRNKEIERNMERLGTVAMGMFNRRTFHSTRVQLRDDIRFFNDGQRNSDAEKDMLEAEKLFGGFFFIYKSQAAIRNPDTYGSESLEQQQVPGSIQNQGNSEAAYEFLHATFGEFLTADFIVRKLLQKTEALHLIEHNARLRTQIGDQLTRIAPDEKDWFSRFIYTSLASRPVVLDMLREWVRCHPQNEQNNDFHRHLTSLLTPQLQLVLASEQIPSVLMIDQQPIYQKLPLVGYLATYSLNLILLLTVLIPGKQPFIFDETMFGLDKDMPSIANHGVARPWDRMYHLWRSWFSLESLSELTAVFIAQRKDTCVHISVRQTFAIPDTDTKLDLILNVAQSLGDNVTFGLAGLIAVDRPSGKRRSLNRIGKQLHDEGIILEAEVLAQRLQRARQHLSRTFDSLKVPEASYKNMDEQRLKEKEEADEQRKKIIEQIKSLVEDAGKLLSEDTPPTMSFNTLASALIDVETEVPFVLDQNIVVALGRYCLLHDVQPHVALGIVRITLRSDDLRVVFTRATLQNNAISLLLSNATAPELIQVACSPGIEDTVANGIHDFIQNKPLDLVTDDLTIKRIHLARRVNDQQFLRRVYETYVTKEISPEHRIPWRSRRKPHHPTTLSLLIELIRLAYQFEDVEQGNRFYQELKTLSYKYEYLETAPIAAFQALAWVMQSTDDRRALIRLYQLRGTPIEPSTSMSGDASIQAKLDF